MGRLLQALLRNESGGRNVANVDEGTSSGQAQGFFQITEGTWKDFGGGKYAANPMKASYAQQAEVASRIPLKRWAGSTIAAMRDAGGRRLDPNLTLGENLALHGESFSGGGGGAKVAQTAVKFPYRLEGGARSRANSVSGFQPGFSQALTTMFQNAPPEIQRELAIASGYRDRKVQQALWDASDKTGHTVARPGHSRHEKGTAADLFGFGLKGGGGVSQATKDWVHGHAKDYGLYFPMSYEPWHIQLQGSGGSEVAGAGMNAGNYTAAMNAQTPTPPQDDAVPADSLGAMLGEELTGDDKDKSLPGLLGAMGEATAAPEIGAAPAAQFGAPSGGGLAEYVMNYMNSLKKPPIGGGGMGGQGLG